MISFGVPYIVQVRHLYKPWPNMIEPDQLNHEVRLYGHIYTVHMRLATGSSAETRAARHMQMMERMHKFACPSCTYEADEEIHSAEVKAIGHGLVEMVSTAFGWLTVHSI